MVQLSSHAVSFELISFDFPSNLNGHVHLKIPGIKIGTPFHQKIAKEEKKKSVIVFKSVSSFLINLNSFINKFHIVSITQFCCFSCQIIPKNYINVLKQNWVLIYLYNEMKSTWELVMTAIAYSY